MKAITRIVFLDEEQEKFFGEGPCRLLRAVEETGSLRAAAIGMGMAYSKAFKLIQHAEKSLGFPLMTRERGGKSGGGSHLTEECQDWLKRYEGYRDACRETNEKLFHEYFE